MPDEKLPEPAPPPMAETTVMGPVSAASVLPYRYEVLGELGRGGMGIVYKARDRETGEVLAVKILKPEIAADSRILDRFKNELLLAHRITHRNVARLYEFHRAGEAVYLSMEYVEGESLRALLESTGKLELERGMEIARQLCAGLAEAHRQAIAHRDLKPENIMLATGGELKVMDFGISRSFDANVTATGAIVGTPAYMAPEQAEGKPADHRTDIYSLGLILYEIFTGKAAFTGDTAVTLALKQIRERPTLPRVVAPTVPKHIEHAIMKCLEKDPANRFQSVEEVTRALEGEPVPAGPKRSKLNLRPRWIVAGAAAVVAAAAFWIWSHRTPSDSIHFPLEQFTLSNGLTVALSPDHAAPIFTSVAVYKSGARSDRPGRTGLAHFTEHVMFQGSPNVARGEFSSLVNGAGGTFNSATGAPLTYLWTTLPANQLELALYLEADRMRAIEITPEGLNAARTLLLEERGTYYSAPYLTPRRRLADLAFDNFANRQSGFGSIEDLNAITAEDVAAFHRAYYTPANAALVLVGDFDPVKARDRIRHYFESIPGRPAPPPVDTKEPPRSAEKREAVVDSAVRAPAIMLAWRVPAATDPDWFVVKRIGEALGAYDAARLHTALIKSAGVANNVQVTLEDTGGPNLLSAILVMSPGKDPKQAEELCLQEIERVARDGIPQEELDRLETDALRRRAIGLVSTTQRALAFAQFLADYGRLTVVNEWEKAERRVSSDDIRRVTRKYMTAANRSVVSIAGGKP